MKILVADDEAVSRCILQSMLLEWGYEVIVARDGEEAWNILKEDDSPPVAVLDWVMPGMDGVEVCGLVRRHRKLDSPYLILLTVKDRTKDVVEALRAGANDHVSKPFQMEELRARVEVGVRMVQMRTELADKVRKLQDALAQVQTLQGMLPICCYCKRIRNDQDYWQQVESYISAHAQVRFTHGICPECFKKHDPDNVLCDEEVYGK